MTEPPIDPQTHLGLSRTQLPRHVAIIMDGNGRWAKQRGLIRIQGHEEGAKTVRKIVTHCARLKLEALTLYSFSTENWKRPRDEVDFLMGLYVKYLIAERETIMDNNVRFRHVGRREGLPAVVLEEMDRTVAMSAANTGLTLCLALNYGSRDEIVDAVRAIAERVRTGELAISEINESEISNSLYTRGLPDPDLLIRTANERRVSNFLLWQISYAEIYVSPTLWPDFTPADLDAAIRDFAGRERRFGDIAQ
ncbi:MAG: isoprenyl transferase [Planctomycetes bacterium]|nr:isoprenyl transferase [Planctomycetota bacterium]MBI3834313.1 isoprenyl transferase [Planctomycetota bacterium]